MNLLPDPIKSKSVCFVHDWLVANRGGEKVLETMMELFPEAPIFTLFCNRRKLSKSFQNRRVYTSFLQWIPGITRFYGWLLPIFPLAVLSFNVKSYDLVISSSHCVAKAVKVRKDALHVCYCHTPMRYVWDLTEDYLNSIPRFLRWMARIVIYWLRKWDKKTAVRVHFFIANSNHIKSKIERFYKRKAIVIHPPVTVPSKRSQKPNGETYLIVSALVPYKRVDLAIRAFNELKKPLRVIGDGPLKSQLQSLVQHEGIRIEGWLNDEEIAQAYQNSKALIFPGEEDFGMVPVESQLFGKPVVAYGKGGIWDTVIPYEIGEKGTTGKTGVFFNEQTVEALKKSVQLFETLTFDSDFISRHAQKFGKDRFQVEFLKTLSRFMCC